MSSAPRLSIQDVDPAAYQPMFALEKYIHAGNLGEDLLALVKIRASQINGCAYCLDMHGREARAAGVDDRRLDVLAGWQEAPDLYSPREQAALTLTEEVTLIGEGGVSEETWAQASAEFSEQDIVVLIMAICAINAWNRMAITTRQALPELPAAGSAS
ncbi:carboxymuconolactone decarboxylase family protein [Arthrobacter sp.]|uniref:carboxymuconolactone decarboxylase family protein n=1 Tax=Arthrobacter sp. TaxID=1667 RepID=UPI003A8CCE30